MCRARVRWADAVYICIYAVYYVYVYHIYILFRIYMYIRDCVIPYIYVYVYHIHIYTEYACVGPECVGLTRPVQTQVCVPAYIFKYLYIYIFIH